MTATVHRGFASIQFVVFVLAFVTSCAHVDQSGITSLVPALRPQVVLIKAFDRTGAERAQASGVAVAPHRVVTAAHVLLGAFSLQVIDSNNQILDVAGVVTVDHESDSAVIAVSGTLIPAKIGASQLIQVGQRVVAVGNPNGLEGTVSEGIISGVRTEGGHQIFQTTAPISPGSSGGGLFDTRGTLIGITVAQIRDGQNLNFAVPIDRIRPLIAADGPVQSVGVGKRWIKTDLEQRSLIGHVRELKTEYVRFVWNGRQWSEEPRQLATIERFNRLGLTSEVEYYDKSTHKYVYDAHGVLQSIVTPAGAQTVIYDDATRQSSIQHGIGKTVETYDATGNLVEHQGLLNIVYRYNQDGVLVESTTFGTKGDVSERTRYEYDSQGILTIHVVNVPSRGWRWTIEYRDYVWDDQRNWVTRREIDTEMITVWYRTILYY